MIQVTLHICYGLVRPMDQGEIGSFGLICIDTLMSSRPNNEKSISRHIPGKDTWTVLRRQYPLAFNDHETTLASSANDMMVREDADRGREVEVRRGLYRQWWWMLENG
jgi:hypothetical protein